MLRFQNSLGHFQQKWMFRVAIQITRQVRRDYILIVMALKDINAGRSMARFRIAKGLSMRDVYDLSKDLARIRNNTDFLIPPSRLSDIESKGVIPSLHRLYTLSIAYGCTMQKLLKLYGLDIGAYPIPRGKIRAITERRQRTPLRVRSRLTAETRTRIERLLFETQFTQSEIAQKCGVSQSKVGTIAREIGLGPRMRRSNCARPPLSSRDRGIIRLARKGRTYREIGQLYGVTRQRAQQIMKLYGDKLSSRC